MQNALSVDVEDWFQVGAFETVIARDAWETLPRRVERNTDAVLALFDEAGVKATFFTLGWVAERHPALIRRIADGRPRDRQPRLGPSPRLHDERGRVPRRSRPRPRRDRGCVAASGSPAIARRASRSTPRTPWAHPVLAEQGYAYSSSVAPIRHDHYGWPEAPRFAWRPVAGADLIELPVTTVELAGRRFAAGGGGFFRLLPYALLQLGDRAGQRRARSGRPSSISTPGRSIPASRGSPTRRSNRGCAITPISPRCAPSC